MDFTHLFDSPVIFRGLTITKPTLMGSSEYAAFLDALPAGWRPVGAPQLEYIHARTHADGPWASMGEDVDAHIAADRTGWDLRAESLQKLYGIAVVSRSSPDHLDFLDEGIRWWSTVKTQVRRSIVHTTEYGDDEWGWDLAGNLQPVAYAIAVKME